jgi:hypothetical protein
VARTWPVVYGPVDFTVRRSNLVDPRAYQMTPGNAPRFAIYDSSVDHVAAYNGALVYLDSSKIRNDIQANGSGTVVYGYRVTSRSGSPFLIFQESGGKYVELAAPGPPWR